MQTRLELIQGDLIKAKREKFVEQTPKAPDRIQFVLWDDKTYTCYVNVLSKLGFGLFCLIG